jgi:hypothetical protein
MELPELPPAPEAAAPPAPGMSRRRRAYWLAVSLLWGLCAFWIYAPLPAAWIEAYYSRGLYRLNVALLTPLTSLYPNSLALILVVLIVLGLPAAWIAWWVHGRRTRALPHRRALGVAFRTLMVLIPLVMLWFVLFWGAGYRRVPAEQRLNLDTAAITDEEAAALRETMFEILVRDLPAPGDRDVRRAVAAIAEAMRGVVLAWDGRAVTLPARVKATPPGLLLANGTSGMAVPLTLEPHVDGGLPDTAFVQTAAHELGHVAGINVEAEATLIGYVAGLQAADPYARYAVALDVYIDLARQLPKEAYAAAIARLPQEAQDDLKAAREAGARYRIDWYRQYSWRVYDKYLQSQGIAEGRKNYSRGITLFTFAWRKGLVKPAGPETDV